VSDTLSALQEALNAALTAPAAPAGEAEEDDTGDIASPRAKAAASLKTALQDRLNWHWDRDEHQGELLCRALIDICGWLEHATLRGKALDLQCRGIALLAAVPNGEPSAGDAGELQDDWEAIKPRDDDAGAIAAAYGFTPEEAKAWGLVGTLTHLGLDEEEALAPPAGAQTAGTPGTTPVVEETLEQLFRREASQRARRELPAALQRFWSDQKSMDLLISVRRGFHTIKGDARMAAVSSPPEVQEELEGLAVLSEAAEDIIDYLLGDDYDPAQPAPTLPPGAFSLMSETATAIARRLEIRQPLSNEVPLLKRLAAMQRKAAALAGVVIDEASLAAKIPLSVTRTTASRPASQARLTVAMGSPLLPTFMDEAKRLMSDLHRALGILSTNPADEGSLLLARRKLHTLKGGAALVGEEAAAVQAVAHHAEDLFELIEDYQLQGELSEVPREVLGGVLDAEDALQSLLDELERRVATRGARQALSEVPAGLIDRLQDITDRVRGGAFQRSSRPVATIEPVRSLDATQELYGPDAADAPAGPQAAAAQPRQPVAKTAGLREVGFGDLIASSSRTLPRSRTAVIDRAAAVEERARMATAPFTLFVGVQHLAPDSHDLARYRDLAGSKGEVYVFAQLDEAPVAQARVTLVPLQEGDQLLHERFAIYEGPEHTMAFLALDRADDPGYAGRRFDTLALDDPAVIHEAAGRLRTALRQDGSLIATRHIGLQSAAGAGLTRLPRLEAPPSRRRYLMPLEQAPRRAVDVGREASVRTALGALEELTVTRDTLQALVIRLEQQRTESRRSGARLRALVERVGSELAGLRSELVRTTRHSGEWDLLEKEEYTTVDALLGQLDEALADLEESDSNLRRDLGEARAQVEIQSDKALSVQRALLDINMVPLARLEDRLAHAVRSQSRRLNKQVAFSLEGGDVVLDGRIADALFPPMIHLINNAIGHGIEESSAARVAAGKTVQGQLTVRGRTSGDGVAIDVIDDGRGIDAERVASVAVSRGLITAGEAAQLTTDEKIALIWRPGFSTAATVTAMSGRGIGMKSAQDDIAALSGRIEVASVPGHGTTFTVVLPRSLAMLRVEVVREGSSLVALPITQMVATHSVPYAMLAALKPGQSVRTGDRSLTMLGVCLAGGPAGDGEAGHATLLEVAGRDVAIVVDEVLGSQYLPVRAAPGYLRRHCGLLGYAIGGGGHILPILDLPTLVDRSAAGGIIAPEQTRVAVASNVLVVDDSQTMRRALRDTLGKAGFNVLEAADGHDALDICIRHMPDLITLDMEMPGMDGLEALTALRLLPHGGATVPVFMITSRQQARHRAAALAAGVTRYFTKPFDSDELLSAMNLVLAENPGHESEEAS